MASDVLTAFSPRAEFLAIATADGRVKTWDVGNGHLRGEFVDIAASTSGAAGELNGHLAVDYSCVAWGSLPSVSKKGKKKGSKDGQLVLVLGTGSGDVLAWDAALGQLRWRTSDCNAGGVKAVAFSNDGQTLYTAGADGMICELKSGTGEVVGKFRAAKTPVSSIAVSPDGNSLLAASSELKLFDLSSKKRICKFAGHAAVVNALCFSQDGKYALSSATGERQVAVWRVGGGKSDRGALFSLSLDHAAVAVNCGSFDSEDCKVVAVSTTGVAYVWHASTVEQLETVEPVKVSVPVTKPGKGFKPSVLAACLDNTPETLLVAHGTSAKPIFEHVTIGAAGSQVVLEAESGGALLPASHPNHSANQSKAETVTVLGPDNAADAVIARPLLESGELHSTAKKTKKKRQASVDLDAEPPHKDSQSTELQQHITAVDGDVADPMDEDDDEQTMEEKLIALGIADKVPGKDEDAGAVVVPPRADSVQVLLSQALQADDSALLERCLAVSDEKVIGNTVRTLLPSEAAKFLSACIVKLETRPRRGLALVPWVRTVLLQHAASLMSNPAMQPVLATLYQLIEARLSVFRPLLALSGRLDLIMAQISSKDAELTEDSDAVVVYEEEDSEVEVEEVEDDCDGEGDGSSEELSEDDSDSEYDVSMQSAEEAEVKPQGNGNGHLVAADTEDESD